MSEPWTAKTESFCANKDCQSRDKYEKIWQAGKGIAFLHVAVRVADRKRHGPFRVNLCHDCYERITKS